MPDTVLRMTFDTGAGGARSISVRGPKPGLDESQVRAAAAHIVDARLHAESAGQLSGLRRAELVTTVRAVVL